MNNNKVMENYKKIYENEKMSDEAVVVMKKRMAEAKMEKQKIRYAQTYKKLAIAAAVALVIIVTPNASSTAAYAMGNVPVLGSFFRLITIRNYTYNDGYNTADVDISELIVEKDESTPLDGILKNTVDAVNKDIDEITDKYIEEFEKEKANQGYSDIKIDSEIINTSEKYVTLKLTCYTASADSYTEVHYYNIDLENGKKIQLSDLFKAEADYKNVLQEEIYSQMRKQVADGDEVSYWLDDEFDDDWTFDSVGDDMFFYINERNKLVIGFNQGAVGPMSNGVCEFEIQDEVTKDILK